MKRQVANSDQGRFASFWRRTAVPNAEWRLLSAAVAQIQTRGCELLLAASHQPARSRNFQHNEFSADAFSTQSIRAPAISEIKLRP